MRREDHEAFSAALAHVEVLAEQLPWAKKRSWRTATHIWDESGLPVIDLHDLSVKLAVEVVDSIERMGKELPCGAVALITGRGRHSIGKSPLRSAVGQALSEWAAEGQVEMRPQGPGRFVLIVDRARAPAAATGKPPVYFWLFVGLIVVAIAIVMADKLAG